MRQDPPDTLVHVSRARQNLEQAARELRAAHESGSRDEQDHARAWLFSALDDLDNEGSNPWVAERMAEQGGEHA